MQPATRITALAAATLFLATAAIAAPITGVTATASNASTAAGTPDHLVDGSGLTAYTTTATAALAAPANIYRWLNIANTITFNLHGIYALSGMTVWNFNGNPIYGVKDVKVSESMDGLTYTTFAGAPTVFAEGSLNSHAEAGETLAFTTTAAFIQISVTSDYGFSGSAGLDEVMFSGTLATPVAVPETASLLLFGAGLLGLLGARRRAA